MALREFNPSKMNAENANVPGRKDAPVKRGALGEIGNKVGVSFTIPVGKPLVSKAAASKLPVHKPIAVKNIQAKVVSRHNVVAPKATAKPRPVTRKSSSSTVVQSRVGAVEAVVKPVVKDKPKPNDATKVVIPPAQLPPAQLPQASTSAEELPTLVPDDDEEDPQMVAVYVTDIYKYLRSLEFKFIVHHDHLSGQTITKKMRAILIDWLAEVHQQFKLLPESLYITTAIIDRFLQDYKDIDRKSLQLVGVAAMSLACKYEEMFAPDIADFVYITDNAYTKKQILLMEGHILNTLNFNFGRPIPLYFLRRFSKISRSSVKEHTLSKYLLELALLEYSMCHLDPSIMAAASLFLSHWLLGGFNTSVWTYALIQCSTYQLSDIEPVVRQLATMVLKAPTCPQQTIRKKYAVEKYHSISCLPELESKELQDLAG